MRETIFQKMSFTAQDRALLGVSVFALPIAAGAIAFRRKRASLLKGLLQGKTGTLVQKNECGPKNPHSFSRVPVAAAGIDTASLTNNYCDEDFDSDCAALGLDPSGSLGGSALLAGQLRMMAQQKTPSTAPPSSPVLLEALRARYPNLSAADLEEKLSESGLSAFPIEEKLISSGETSSKKSLSPEDVRLLAVFTPGEIAYLLLVPACVILSAAGASWAAFVAYTGIRSPRRAWREWEWAVSGKGGKPEWL